MILTLIEPDFDLDNDGDFSMIKQEYADEFQTLA
jgi:hypothetical protein